MKITPFQRLQGLGLAAYARLVWRTARYDVHGLDVLDRVRETGRPYIFACWHGMTLMLTGFVVGQEDNSVLRLVVPDDHRGAVLSVWVRRAGAEPYTISMKEQSLVAARRLLSLVRELKGGKRLYLNPDGPEGPTHEPKKGVAFISRKAEATIIPMAGYTSACLRMPRWDRYTIPFPYSRITIVLGEPYDAPQTGDLEEARIAIRERLNDAERSAEALYRAGPDS